MPMNIKRGGALNAGSAEPFGEAKSGFAEAHESHAIDHKYKVPRVAGRTLGVICR